MSKKLLSILCVVLCLCLVLTACGDSGSKKSGSKTDKSSSSKTEDKDDTESTGSTQAGNATTNGTQQTESNNSGNSNYNPNWPDTIKFAHFNNVTLKLEVTFTGENAPSQPDAMVYALNGNMVKMDDGNFEEDAETAQMIRNSMIGVVLDLLSNTVITYNETEDLYTAPGSACRTTVMEFEAYITATDIVFTIEDGRLTSFTSKMVQDISTGDNEEYALEMEVKFTFSNYGTTGQT